jgi:3-hydroxyisobutyrate dehydrogenase-like beta-hydroxyacid dehydrogenase
MHAGFVGTGNMGRPMAAHIPAAGHQLTVFDLDPEATCLAYLESLARRSS